MDFFAQGLILKATIFNTYLQIFISSSTKRQNSIAICSVDHINRLLSMTGHFNSIEL